MNFQFSDHSMRLPMAMNFLPQFALFRRALAASSQTAPLLLR